jgi:DNA (cytosine-5)-methyltransferase 1
MTVVALKRVSKRMAEQSEATRPRAIDLFAGAGGMSLGFEQAGFDVVAAVEIDPIHCATHEFNFPDCAVIAQSVVGLSAAEIRRRAGIGNAPVDCVFGGPPCQGFSLIGRRILDDPRNRLVLEFVRLVDELGARSFVFENVKGLTVGKSKALLTELVEAFERRGYQVAKPWQVLNAANYGVPQSRERLFLIGSKRGESLPAYPAFLTTRPDGKRPVEGLPPGPTCVDAIGDLPDADSFDSLAETDAVRTKRYGAPSPYAAEMRCLSDESWHLGRRRLWDSDVLTSSARTEHTPISRRRFEATACGKVEPISRFFKLSPDGLCNTLRAGTDGARGAFTSPRPIHYRYSRCITVREMARLHGFPDWYRFHSTKWHGARQIGNAVPPPLARAVAGQIVQALGATPMPVDEAVELGSAQLLYLEMAEAAERYGVPKPSSRRDQKSGNRKRKQQDIENERLKAVANG